MNNTQSKRKPYVRGRSKPRLQAHVPRVRLNA